MLPSIYYCWQCCGLCGFLLISDHELSTGCTRGVLNYATPMCIVCEVVSFFSWFALPYFCPVAFSLFLRMKHQEHYVSLSDIIGISTFRYFRSGCFSCCVVPFSFRLGCIFCVITCTLIYPRYTWTGADVARRPALHINVFCSSVFSILHVISGYPHPIVFSLYSNAFEI